MTATPCALGAEAVDLGRTAFGAFELHEGGLPLAQVSFGRGWPTDRSARELTDFARQSGVDVTASLLGAVGPSIRASAYMSARRGSWKDDVEVCAALAGFEGATGGLDVAFLPVPTAAPELAAPFQAEQPASWRWKGSGSEHTLEALGFALMAEAELARQQLTIRRADGGLGRTPREGLVALLALHSACAKVWELRHRLHLDADAGALAPQAELRALPSRQFRFPTAWTSDESAGQLTHTGATEGEASRSHLRAQAAVLIGLTRLAALCGPAAPGHLQDLFSEQSVAGKTVTPFPSEVPLAVMETALFAFRSIRSLHVTVSGSGGAASTADAGGPGATIAPTDLGLFLMALEGLIDQIQAPASWRSAGKGLEADLEDERKKARRLVAPLGAVIRTWLLNQPGFHDAYDVATSARATRSRSLASQGFAVRGLLAAHRLLLTDPDPKARAAAPEVLAAAREAIRWLDQFMWDPAARAYVEKDAQGASSAPAFGALAVLGALRELALLTGEGAFLLRFRQHLASLRDAGLVQEGAGRTAPNLRPAVDLGQAGKKR